MSTDAQTEDFDVGKAIFDQLKGLPPERQERVLRWVAEAVGVRGPVMGPSGTLATAPQTPRQVWPGTSAVPGTAPDIKTFMAAKAPQSDNQFATAVAYYYRFEAPPDQRRDTITAEILQDAARLVGRKRLSDPSKTLNNAKGVGYLDAAATGEFGINNVGENLIAMTLPGAAKPSAHRIRKKIKSRARPKRAAKAAAS